MRTSGGALFSSRVTLLLLLYRFFFFSSRRRHTRCSRDWSSDVCSSDLATLTFAFAGLELAPTLGDEIHDPARTLRRGIAVSGLAIVAMYVLGTAAMLVALPHDTVSITNGMPQATAALVERLGAGWLAPGAAIVAILLVLGNLGGVGAWVAGSSRPPYGAGRGGALAAAVRRVPPRWQTPHARP